VKEIQPSQFLFIDEGFIKGMGLCVRFAYPGFDVLGSLCLSFFLFLFFSGKWTTCYFIFYFFMVIALSFLLP